MIDPLLVGPQFNPAAVGGFNPAGGPPRNASPSPIPNPTAVGGFNPAGGPPRNASPSPIPSSPSPARTVSPPLVRHLLTPKVLLKTRSSLLIFPQATQPQPTPQPTIAQSPQCVFPHTSLVELFIPISCEESST